MGKDNHTSVNPPTPSVAGQPTSERFRSRSLTKLTVPPQQPITTPPSTAYYDTYDHSHKTPISAEYHTDIEPGPGCKNGGLGKSLNGLLGGVPAPVSTTPVTPTIKSNHRPTRGVSKAVASPTAHELTPAPFVRHSAPLAISVPRPAKKKALLVGINYRQRGKPGLQLRYATQDARRFATTLSKLGYSNENIEIATDEPDQPFPSREYLLECMDRLVQDALPGDQLFFVYAGHCNLPGMGGAEPYLLTADLGRISRLTFQDRLVAKVPAGVELTIVLDCCNAAAIVQLKYCIGRMESENQSSMTKQTSVGTFFVVPGRKIDGIPGVLPLSRAAAAVSNPLPSPRPIAPMMGMRTGTKSAHMPVKQAASIDRSRGRHLVVEGRPIWQFEEHTGDFVTPAGKIIVYAASGERQKAFEASGGVKNGVVTDAICKILDTCSNKLITQHEVALCGWGCWRREPYAPTARRKQPKQDSRKHSLESAVAVRSDLGVAARVLELLITTP
ncbi:hypothetical protein ACGC1H_005075 [Rhizoctonia solani]